CDAAPDPFRSPATKPPFVRCRTALSAARKSPATIAAIPTGNKVASTSSRMPVTRDSDRRFMLRILTFINRQETVVERETEQRHRCADRRTVLPLEAAVRRLRLLELADQKLVPFLPRLDVPLKQGLGLVVAGVFGPALLGRLFETLREVTDRRLELRQIFAAGDRVDERPDGNAGQRLVEAPHAAGVGHLP